MRAKGSAHQGPGSTTVLSFVFSTSSMLPNNFSPDSSWSSLSVATWPSFNCTESILVASPSSLSIWCYHSTPLHILRYFNNYPTQFLSLLKKGFFCPSTSTWPKVYPIFIHSLISLQKSQSNPYSTSLWQIFTLKDLHDCWHLLLASPSIAGLQWFLELFFFFLQLDDKLLDGDSVYTESCNNRVLIDLIPLFLSARSPLSASPSPGSPG